MKNLICLFVSFLLFASLASVHAQGKKLYRYIDDNGVKVISSQIPAAFVKKGYEVLTADGVVIETIAPEPSEEEKVEILKRQAEQERLARWDRALLQRYSSVADIEAAKKRSLLQLKTEISIRDRGIDKINNEINDIQVKAAEIERSGRPVSDAMLMKLEQLRDERELELALIDSLKTEQNTVTERYDEDIKRFMIIRPE